MMMQRQVPMRSKSAGSIIGNNSNYSSCFNNAITNTKSNNNNAIVISQTMKKKFLSSLRGKIDKDPIGTFFELCRSRTSPYTSSTTMTSTRASLLYMKQKERMDKEDNNNNNNNNNNNENQYHSQMIYEIIHSLLYEACTVPCSIVNQWYDPITKDTPLHVVCSNPVLSSNLRLIKLFVDASTDHPITISPVVQEDNTAAIISSSTSGSTNSNNNENKIENENENEVVSVDSTSDPTNSGNSHSYGRTKKGFGTPLHRICQHLHHRNHHHSSCKGGSPGGSSSTITDVVEFLIQRDPAAVCIADDASNHNLPLHEVCIAASAASSSCASGVTSMSSSHMMEVVIMLLQQWPDSCKAPNADGDLPLHLAVRIDNSNKNTVNNNNIIQNPTTNHSTFAKTNSFVDDNTPKSTKTIVDYDANSRILLEIEAFSSLGCLDDLFPVQYAYDEVTYQIPTTSTNHMSNDRKDDFSSSTSCGNTNENGLPDSGSTVRNNLPRTRALPTLVQGTKKDQYRRNSMYMEGAALKSRYAGGNSVGTTCTRRRSNSFTNTDNGFGTKRVVRSKSVSSGSVPDQGTLANGNPTASQVETSSSTGANTSSRTATAATSTTQLDIVKYLVVYYPAALNLQNKSGYTPIQVAFVSAMASSSTTIGQGSLAAASRHPVIQFLQSYMATTAAATKVQPALSHTTGSPVNDDSCRGGDYSVTGTDGDDEKNDDDDDGPDSTDQINHTRYFQIKQLPSSPTVMTLPAFTSTTTTTTTTASAPKVTPSSSHNDDDQLIESCEGRNRNNSVSSDLPSVPFYISSGSNKPLHIEHTDESKCSMNQSSAPACKAVPDVLKLSSVPSNTSYGSHDDDDADDSNSESSLDYMTLPKTLSKTLYGRRSSCNMQIDKKWSTKNDEITLTKSCPWKQQSEPSNNKFQSDVLDPLEEVESMMELSTSMLFDSGHNSEELQTSPLSNYDGSSKDLLLFSPNKVLDYHDVDLILDPLEGGDDSSSNDDVCYKNGNKNTKRNAPNSASCKDNKLITDNDALLEEELMDGYYYDETMIVDYSESNKWKRPLSKVLSFSDSTSNSNESTLLVI